MYEQQTALTWITGVFTCTVHYILWKQLVWIKKLIKRSADGNTWNEKALVPSTSNKNPSKSVGPVQSKHHHRLIKI